MSVIKKRLPITFFERFKTVVNKVYPEFFNSTTPDIPTLEKRLKQIHDRTGKKSTRKELHTAMEAAEIEMLWYDSIVGFSDRAIEHARKMREKYGTCTLHKLPEHEQPALADTYWINGHSLVDNDDDMPNTVHPADIYANKRNRLFWSMHRFNRRGRKTFRIEEQLFHELLLTDVSRVDATFLRLPYPTICFHLPFNNKLKMRDLLVEWVYVTELMVVDGEGAERKLEFVFITKSGLLIVDSITLPASGDLVTQLEKKIADAIPSPMAKREVHDMFSFLMAAVLYMTSTEVTYANVFPQVFAKKQDSIYPACSLGYGITINKSLHYQATDDTPESEQHKHVLKWTVRGHFRTLDPSKGWYKERKVKWIAPYLKGGERGNADQAAKPTHYNIK